MAPETEPREPAAQLPRFFRSPKWTRGGWRRGIDAQLFRAFCLIPNQCRKHNELRGISHPLLQVRALFLTTELRRLNSTRAEPFITTEAAPSTEAVSAFLAASLFYRQHRSRLLMPLQRQLSGNRNRTPRWWINYEQFWWYYSRYRRRRNSYICREIDHSRVCATRYHIEFGFDIWHHRDRS